MVNDVRGLELNTQTAESCIGSAVLPSPGNMSRSMLCYWSLH